jgi:DNA-directed RNA polymerase subunit RPC12/RpoP
VPENVRCCHCGTTVLGLVSMMQPVDREECPECGGTSFEVIDDGGDC